jgi:hypothetical protein
MSKTTVPAIPAITADNIQQVAAAVKNLLDIREGLIGDPLDANVTFRDLLDAGLAKQNFAVKTNSAAMSHSVIFPVSASIDGYDPALDLNPPQQPVGFSASSGLTSVILSWTRPTYRNHSYTEIWRSTTNVIGNAVLLGTSDTSFFTDAVGKTSTTYYYWIRFVSQANIFGPYNGTSGVSSTTGTVGSVDLSDLIITADKLAADAVVEGKIKDAAVTTTKIANLAVGNAAIANGAITNAKIANLAVDNAKINDLNAAKINAGFLSADRIEAGSITATKIDSRNLSIKDADGNVIFSAGTNLAIGRVSGAGAFATIDKITGTNVSTYIDSAAIKLAQIDTASITNLSSIKADMGTITAGKMNSTDDLFIIDLTNKFISISV